jgi:hypothetical protein
VSSVQALPSSQASVVPGVHTPEAHFSAPLQTSLSEQEVPSSTLVGVHCPVAGEQACTVQRLLSWPQSVGWPAWQTPFWQVCPSHLSVAEHGVPFGS